MSPAMAGENNQMQLEPNYNGCLWSSDLTVHFSNGNVIFGKSCWWWLVDSPSTLNIMYWTPTAKDLSSAGTVLQWRHKTTLVRSRTFENENCFYKPILLFLLLQQIGKPNKKIKKRKEKVLNPNVTADRVISGWCSCCRCAPENHHEGGSLGEGRNEAGDRKQDHEGQQQVGASTSTGPGEGKAHITYTLTVSVILHTHTSTHHYKMQNIIILSKKLIFKLKAG